MMLDSNQFESLINEGFCQTPTNTVHMEHQSVPEYYMVEIAQDQAKEIIQEDSFMTYSERLSAISTLVFVGIWQFLTLHFGDSNSLAMHVIMVTLWSLAVPPALIVSLLAALIPKRKGHV
jgi:ABC-type siderophore export system fused ATPase/permease subunit